MKVWHVGALPSPNEVDGVNTTVWQVARGQALLGHQVALVLDKPPDEAAIGLAEQTGIKLLHVPASTLRYNFKVLKSLLGLNPPQLVHMHSRYLPSQVILAWQLVRDGIPFVVTPNGALTARRYGKRLKKGLYVSLVEKPRLRAASAITVVDPQEEEVVRAAVPKYRGVVRWIPNPVDTHSLEGHGRGGNVAAKRLVFLGRFHVVHKGLDVLVDIASLMPDVEFHLYGTDDGRTKRMLEELCLRAPANVHFHGPVFGAEKARVLADASLYIQASRWEGFPLSVIEAMYLGVPCAVASTIYQAKLFRREDLGLVFPPRPEEAAVQLSEALAQPARLRHWSQRSRDFARETFDPLMVASKYLKLYEEVLHMRGSSQSSSRKVHL